MRLRVLLIVLLSGLALRTTLDAKSEIGIDFYHFWLPAQARAAADTDLGDLYGEQQRYAAVINARADALWRRFGVDATTIEQHHADLSAVPPIDRRGELFGDVVRRLPHEAGTLFEQNRFLTVNLRRRTVDLTATPLQYAVFAFLPADYDAAISLFRALQSLCFLMATLILCRAAGAKWSEGWLLGVAAMVLFAPYRSDLAVGNFNSPHLLVAAVALWIAAVPLRRTGDQRGRILWTGACMTVLAAYALLKPNFALAGLGLVAHLALVGGRKVFVAGLGLGIAGGLLLMLWPCLYFGSFGVWTDWLGYIGSSSDKLAYDVDKFNASTTLQLATWFGGATSLYAALLGTALLGSCAWMLAAAPGDTFAARCRAGAERVLRDPFAPAVIGLVLTLGLSPLVWGHYLIAVMIAIAWMLRPGTGVAPVLWLTLATVLASCSFLPIPEVFFDVDYLTLARICVMAAWLPLWIGVVQRLRTELGTGTAPA